jgi:hypothetical protein
MCLKFVISFSSKTKMFDKQLAPTVVLIYFSYTILKIFVKKYQYLCNFMFVYTLAPGSGFRIPNL